MPRPLVRRDVVGVAHPVRFDLLSVFVVAFVLSLVTSSAGCTATSDVRGRSCESDAQCTTFATTLGAEGTFYCQAYCPAGATCSAGSTTTGVCLAGEPPVTPRDNTPAQPREALIVASLGGSAAGDFVTFDIDGDPIRYPPARIDVDDGNLGTLIVDEGGHWTLTAPLAAGRRRVVVPVQETWFDAQEREQTRTLELPVFVVIIDGSSARLTTWTGLAGGDVADAGNWSDGVPDAQTDALIVPAPSSPSLRAPLQVRDLFTTPGTTLALGTHALVVHGAQLLAGGVIEAAADGDGVVVQGDGASAPQLAGRISSVVVQDGVVACLASSLVGAHLRGALDVRGSSIDVQQLDSAVTLARDDAPCFDGQATDVGDVRVRSALSVRQPSRLGAATVVVDGDVDASAVGADEASWQLVAMGDATQRVQARHVGAIDHRGAGTLLLAGTTEVHERLRAGFDLRVQPGLSAFVEDLDVEFPLAASADDSGALYAHRCHVSPLLPALPAWIHCDTERNDPAVVAVLGRADGAEGEGEGVVVAEGEGEGVVAEGEGEGVVAEGEGEGEGVVAEGEGEGVVAEGEGEGTPAADACARSADDDDLDGFTNAAECAPADRDGNGNGIARELDPCEPSVAAGPCDRDGDTLTNAVEAARGTNASLVDTDGDGKRDDVEGTADTDADLAIDALESDVVDDDGDGLTNEDDNENADACLPSNAAGTCDRDGDTLTNAVEATRGTNASLVDTDGDGKRDDVEGTADTDFDGVIDALESDDLDTDNDGTNNELDPQNLNACLPSNAAGPCDRDGDTLTNAVEAARGTNASLADTDGDGKRDDVEGTADSDGDGIIDPLESATADADSDGASNEVDAANADPCVPSLAAGPCDRDGDGRPNANDNCPTVVNADQVNTIGGPNDDGDVCDDSDADGTTDAGEGAVVGRDTDGDGTIDALESASADRDNDGTDDENDPANADPCIPDAASAACVPARDACHDQPGRAAHATIVVDKRSGPVTIDNLEANGTRLDLPALVSGVTMITGATTSTIDATNATLTSTLDAPGHVSFEATLAGTSDKECVELFVVDSQASSTQSSSLKRYVGESQGSWLDAANWSPAGVPTATDVVFLPARCGSTPIACVVNVAPTGFGDQVQRAGGLWIASGVGSSLQLAQSPSPAIEVRGNVLVGTSVSTNGGAGGLKFVAPTAVAGRVDRVACQSTLTLVGPARFALLAPDLGNAVAVGSSCSIDFGSATTTAGSTSGHRLAIDTVTTLENFGSFTTTMTAPRAHFIVGTGFQPAGIGTFTATWTAGTIELLDPAANFTLSSLTSASVAHRLIMHGGSFSVQRYSGTLVVPADATSMSISMSGSTCANSGGSDTIGRLGLGRTVTVNSQICAGSLVHNGLSLPLANLDARTNVDCGSAGTPDNAACSILTP